MLNPCELEPSVEVTHLRRVLDTQPSCLMRLAADGTVFAANNAALALLGVKAAAQALGQRFTRWLPPDQHERWREFCAGVLTGASASIECEMIAPAGERHPVLFHGVPLCDHPDGTPSMAVAARAVSSQRQLETAIVRLEAQLRERDRESVQARARVAEAESLRRQIDELKSDIDAREAALASAVAARQAAETERARALADTRQLELALEAFAARQKRAPSTQGEGRA
jgi:PAS domain S-box-containing protein